MRGTGPNPCGLALAAALLVPSAAAAREWQSERHNFEVTLPDGADWKIQKNADPEIVLSITHMKDARTLAIAVTREHASVLTDEMMKAGEREFLDGVKRGVGVQPTKTYGRKLEVRGHPAYEVAGKLTFMGQEMTVLARFFIAGGRVYSLSLGAAGRDVTADPELQAMLNSFRFLKAPAIGAAGEAPKRRGLSMWIMVGVLLGLYVVYRIVRRD